MICNTKIFINYEKYIFACDKYNFARNTSKFGIHLINLVTSITCVMINNDII